MAENQLTIDIECSVGCDDRTWNPWSKKISPLHPHQVHQTITAFFLSLRTDLISTCCSLDQKPHHGVPWSGKSHESSSRKNAWTTWFKCDKLKPLVFQRCYNSFHLGQLGLGKVVNKPEQFNPEGANGRTWISSDTNPFSVFMQKSNLGVYERLLWDHSMRKHPARWSVRFRWKRLFSKMLPGSSYLQWLSIHAAAHFQQSSVTSQYSD